MWVGPASVGKTCHQWMGPSISGWDLSSVGGACHQWVRPAICGRWACHLWMELSSADVTYNKDVVLLEHEASVELLCEILHLCLSIRHCQACVALV